ncbi:hypothetical protein JNM87_05965 [Candidatus Saccharibacteria bacterium]|nr:hypothetical protein [Candidatus Saccharibacteria bacterium]
MKKAHQNGFSVVEVVLIIFALGIVSFIGWFVWQGQQSDGKVTEDSDSSSSARVDDLKKDASKTKASDADLVAIKADGGRVTVMAPKSWKVNTKPNETPELNYPDTVTITAPSEDVYVQFKRYGGLGGACIPEENSQRITKVNTVGVVGDPSLTFAQYYISDTTYGGYVANLVKTDATTDLKEGANSCSAFLLDMIPEFKGTDTGAANFGVYSKKLETKVQSGTKISASEYDAFVSSADFQTAKDILLSLED